MTEDGKIARLQKQVGRLQLATVAMGLGLAAVLVTGAARDPVQDEIKARRIALVDSRGVERPCRRGSGRRCPTGWGSWCRVRARPRSS